MLTCRERTLSCLAACSGAQDLLGVAKIIFFLRFFCYDNDNHVDRDLQDDDVQDGHDVALATLHDDGDDYD